MLYNCDYYHLKDKENKLILYELYSLQFSLTFLQFCFIT